MINPHIHRLRLLDPNRIPRVREYLPNRQIPHNHVRFPDIQPHALEHGAAVAAQNALVRGDADPLTARDRALDDNDERVIRVRGCGVERGEVGDCDGVAAGAACCAVLLG